MAKKRNNGQTCVSPNRFYIHKDIYEEFLDEFSKEFSSLKIGYSLDTDVSLGPLIDENAVKKVIEHIEDAVSKGAKIVCGGKRANIKFPELKSELYFEPTVLRDCNSDMLCFQEETFGPIASTCTFDTIDEVIKLANDTQYGLACYVFTQDTEISKKLSHELEYGMVAINHNNVSPVHAPFGGIKESGMGREGSVFSVDDYTHIKTMHLRKL